jgi:hypothetical protein
MAAHDRAAIFFGAQAFLVGFRGPLLHDWGQLDPLDRADLGKMRAADHKATHLGTFRARFSLLRHHDIVAYSGAVGRPSGSAPSIERTNGPRTLA